MVVFVILAISLVLTVFYLMAPVSVHMRLAGLDMNKNYVCQTFYGRLGNHVFEYASISGIATLNNLTTLLAYDDDLAQYFEVPSAVKIRSRKICESFVYLKSNHCCVFEPSFMKLKPNENYKIGTFLQSWKYFAHAQEHVRQELTFKKPIRDFAKEIVESFRRQHASVHGIGSQKPVVVGVHLRRGDLLAEEHVKRNAVVVAPPHYIHNAVDFILAKFKNAIFLVCSDSMDYAKEVMKYRNITTKFVHNAPVQDLATLSSCDHVICTFGSFGWWSGFLSRGVVVYFKSPFREGTFERGEYNYDDYFYPDWVGLE